MVPWNTIFITGTFKKSTLNVKRQLKESVVYNTIPIGIILEHAKLLKNAIVINIKHF